MRKKNLIINLKKSFGKMKDDSFHFGLIEKYFLNKEHVNTYQVLSDKTCNDLDFEELFMFIDRTSSKVGQQCLYNKLRAIPEKTSEPYNREKLITNLTDDTDFRIQTQLQLEQLNKTDVYYISSLFQDEYQSKPKWFFIIQLLAFTSILSLLLFPFNPQMIFVFGGVFMINFGFHYWNKKHLYKYLDSLPQLLKLNKIANTLYKKHEFKELDPDIGGSIRIINQVRNRMSFFRLETHLQSETEAIFWAVLELFKIAFLLEPLLLFGVLNQLDTKRKEIENVFCFVGEIDIMLSVASLRKGLDNYCLPEISNSTLSAKNIYHPLISNCITNTIELTDKSVLLTGSNMSGKTSFIRTIGLNMITGLSLNTCFAESVSMPQMRIYSAIRISDDLMNDKSYYFEEVMTIKEMIDNSDNETPNLFLLDEIFKGTNTIERISAGKAVLSKLSKNKNIVFVSTHDIELTDLLSDEFELYHFSEIVKENNVDFDYTLKPGKLTNRNAIRILQINDYPNDLVNEALQTTTKLNALYQNSKI
jgi:DNA mismatch repair ATPase MutS